MKKQILYVELKTGYNDNGPAWKVSVFSQRLEGQFILMVRLLGK
jgi:hypothetical protein